MKCKIGEITSKILSHKIFNYIFYIIPKSTWFGKLIWNGKIFLQVFPWWSKNIANNKIDLFLIFINKKKNPKIYLKNGFIFKNCIQNHWLNLAKYVKILENNFIIKHINNGFIAKIDNLKIFYPHVIGGIKLIDEIFINNCYGKFDYNNKIVIDIGGFIGDSALYFVLKGAKKVYVYEINKDIYEILKENIRINHLENKIITFNKGIGRELKKQTLCFHERRACSGSYIDKYFSDADIVGKRIVDLIPFKDILTEPIDILKIDCEGCEYGVLENILENNLSDKIKEGIILETHNLDEKRNSKYAISLLKKIGFKKIYSDLEVKSKSNILELIHAIR